MTEQKEQKKDTAKESSPAKKTKLKGKSKKKDKANNKEITQLKEQVSSEKDRVLRLSAEFENYQKRKQRELDEFKNLPMKQFSGSFYRLLTTLKGLYPLLKKTLVKKR